MKTITATIYVASDDKEFKTEAECINHENTLKFEELLEEDEIYYSDDFGFNGLFDFNRFDIFVKTNKDWVLEKVLRLQPEN